MNIERVFGNLPTLETERLILRKVTSEDIEDLHYYGSNKEVSKYVTWQTHRTLADTRQYVEHILKLYQDRKLAPWGIEYKETGQFIGTIDFVSWQTKHKIAEIGYALSQDFWGKGIVTEAAYEILEFGFENMDLVRIQAKCSVENRGSERVMEKVGMSFEGIIRKGMFIKGQHKDYKLYSILDEDFRSIQQGMRETEKFV